MSKRAPYTPDEIDAKRARLEEEAKAKLRLEIGPLLEWMITQFNAACDKDQFPTPTRSVRFQIGSGVAGLEFQVPSDRCLTSEGLHYAVEAAFPGWVVSWCQSGSHPVRMTLEIAHPRARPVSPCRSDYG